MMKKGRQEDGRRWGGLGKRWGGGKEGNVEVWEGREGGEEEGRIVGGVWQEGEEGEDNTRRRVGGEEGVRRQEV